MKMSSECDKCGEYTLECGCDSKTIIITDLNFSNRTLNILNEQNIKTLNHLSEFSAGEIMKWRGMGKKTLHDIREKLSSHGLMLKSDILALLEDMKKTISRELPQDLNRLKDKLQKIESTLDKYILKIENTEKIMEKYESTPPSSET